MLLSVILILSFKLIGCLDAGLTDYEAIVYRDCYGNDIHNIPNAKPEDCSKLCDQTAGCVGFVMNTEVTTCYLKSECYFLRKTTVDVAYLIPQDGCPAGWKRYVDHCYKFVLSEGRTRNNASGYCKDEIAGGHLVSINDEKEFDFLLSSIQDNTYLTKDIGYQYPEQIWTSGVRLGNDTWIWHTYDSCFEPFMISELWRDREPNNKHESGENYIVLDMKRVKDVGLNDEHEGRHFPFICESGSICHEGYWGTNCTTQCGHCFGGKRCHIRTGVCTNGCKDGYQPPTCTHESDVKSKVKYTRDIILTAVFSFIGGCLILFIILFSIHRLLNSTTANASTTDVDLSQGGYYEDDVVYENDVGLRTDYENIQGGTRNGNTDGTYEPLKK